MADDKGSGDRGGERRRRRRRGRGPRSGDSKPAPAGDGPSGQKRRRRRGKPQKDGAKPRDRGPRRPRPETDRKPPRERPPKKSTAPAFTDTDLGWDDEPAVVMPEHEESRGKRQTIADAVTWGDDSSAPEPTEPIPFDLPDNEASDPDPTTAELGDGEVGFETIAAIAGVKFTTAGKIYEFDAGDASYAMGDRVSVEGDRSTRVGTIAAPPERRVVTRALKKILRKASAPRVSSDEEKDRDALVRAKKCARDLGLPVKIFRVESHGGRNRVVVYFSSEKKIEQRSLAKGLASELGGRVELRQTGVRDEAKIIGGIGSCGRELCCTTWLPSFVPVSIKNAKDQGLVLNPTKVSGQCGRLKCCLVYEQATYAEARKGLPKLGKRVITEAGEGRVVEVDVLKRRIRVNHGDGRFDVYGADEVEPMFPSQPQGQAKAGEGKRRRRKKKAPVEAAPEDEE